MTTEQPRDDDLWAACRPPAGDEGYDLANPETLNALAAFAEGRKGDPGRERIQARLARSDQALEDLLFLRELETEAHPAADPKTLEKARRLVQPRPVRAPATEGRGIAGLAGDLLALGRWGLLVLGLGLAAVSLTGFELGLVSARQGAAIEGLVVDELPFTLNPAAGDLP